MKTLIANWKMNPQTLGEARTLFDFTVSEAEKLNNIKTVICPPFIFIEELAKLWATDKTEKIFLGAQDVFWETKGPYTGEISIEMMKKFNVSHFLVGHSDRRYVIGENDEVINKKIKTILFANLTPVLFIGEKKAENRDGILADQLIKDLAGISSSDIDKIIFAYEPVWAISTNRGAKPDSPENTLSAIKFIKKFLNHNFKFDVTNLPILYGGSVNQKNIVNYLANKEICGAVIGGASLNKNEFAEMLKLVSKI